MIKRNVSHSSHDLTAHKRKSLQIAFLKSLLCREQQAVCGCCSVHLNRDRVRELAGEHDLNRKEVNRAIEEIWRDGLVEIDHDYKVTLKTKGFETAIRWREHPPNLPCRVPDSFGIPPA